MAKKAKRGTTPRGNWIRPEKRLAIYLRDSSKCVYCQKDVSSYNYKEATLDHVVCKKRGGSNKASNLVTSCRSCNSTRSDKYIHDFCSGETLLRVYSNKRRRLKHYLLLAKACIERRKYDTDND